jgi:branched-chain amino acid transport system permease protein
MDQFVQATILGLATASILAILATGLVLTYTTTGIFNFAHGAMAMLGAFAYWQLRFDWEWPAPLALLVVLGVLAPLVGVLVEVGIMRGLSDAPETVRVVVSISLLVALLGLGFWLWSPQQSYPLQGFWGRSSGFDLAGVRISYHAATAFAIAAALALGLRLLLYRTRPGIAMRAAVDNRGLAALNGARPDRSAMLAWAIGCSCAALGGILISGLNPPLGHVNLTLLVVNAYAAAMIGRLRNLPLTFVGALLLGVADAWAITYLPSGQVWDRFRYALPVVVLFGVLMVLRQPKPRAHGLSRTREHVPKPSGLGALLTAGAFVAAGTYLAQILAEPDARSAARILALAIVGLSLVPLVGFAGQLSLCQLSFAGIGAVVMAHHGQAATLPVVGIEVGNWIGLVYAALAAGAVGALIAIPAIRLGGLYFALATAAFAVMLDQWIFTLQQPVDVGPFDVEVFPEGFASVPRPDLPGAGSDKGLLVLMAVIFALLYLVVAGLRRSSFGQRLLAMKDSPAAAATIGMNLTATKFAVFTFSAGMAGLGGALYGGTLGAQTGSVTAEDFRFFESLPLLLLGVVGGISSAAGALVAGIMLGGMPLMVEQWAWFENLSRVLPGTIGVALGRNPNGIVHDLREAFSPLVRAPLALLATLLATVAVLGIRLGDMVDGWLFLLLLLGAVLLGPVLLRLRETSRRRAESRADDQAAPPSDDVPLEWLGIERPFTAADVAALDEGLGLEPARGGAP